jgi:metal-responsive CopG/Arc/MetJ family transcriptional regulator
VLAEEEKRFRGVSLKKELVDQVEEFVASNPEYKNIADFIHEATRSKMQQIRESRKQRFEHLNQGEVVRIIEHNIDGSTKAVADIYFKQPHIVFCDYCKSTDCAHIDFALKVEKIRETIEGLNKKPGWVIELPDMDS